LFQQVNNFLTSVLVSIGPLVISCDEDGATETAIDSTSLTNLETEPSVCNEILEIINTQHHHIEKNQSIIFQRINDIQCF
jgi:hypothetical protein